MGSDFQRRINLNLKKLDWRATQLLKVKIERKIYQALQQSVIK